MAQGDACEQRAAAVEERPRWLQCTRRRDGDLQASFYVMYAPRGGKRREYKKGTTMKTCNGRRVYTPEPPQLVLSDGLHVIEGEDEVRALKDFYTLMAGPRSVLDVYTLKLPHQGTEPVRPDMAYYMEGDDALRAFEQGLNQAGKMDSDRGKKLAEVTDDKSGENASASRSVDTQTVEPVATITLTEHQQAIDRSTQLASQLAERQQTIDRLQQTIQALEQPALAARPTIKKKKTGGGAGSRPAHVPGVVIRYVGGR